MKLSELFTKTTKNISADESAKSAQLLIRAGFIHKEMAGVYAYLPLGLRVIENIKAIVREEMNAIGGQELLMSSLQRRELWEKTDRWDERTVDIWFKSKLYNGKEVGFGWSHEEAITDMMRNYISSYRDLPVYVYQFQTKFRNELRAKSGIMRGREFMMKDLYSFSSTDKEHKVFYDAVSQAYLRIFARLGLGKITYLTFASGGAFTQFSHEFQAVLEAGEDTIYLDREQKLAVNEEVFTEAVLEQLKLDKSKLEKVKAAEIGNIFSFGTTKSQQLGLYFSDKQGMDQPAVLGSYGIGISRLMGVVAEHLADDKGLIWPINIAPAKAYLAPLSNERSVMVAADRLYSVLTQAGISILYDNRNVRPGQKFADADLMGIPYRIVVSDRTLSARTYECKARTSESIRHLSQAELQKLLTA